MPQKSFASSSPYRTILLGLLVGILVISIILFPEEAFDASMKGLSVWWKFVFPALIPFIILSEILSGLGVVHALGILLEPLMRILFRLPGTGGWALAAGTVAGFPAGSAVTADLRRKRLISRKEGEKLLCLSHLGSPLLIITIIGAGFLHNARLGLILLAIHYLAALCTGILLPGVKKGRFARPGTRNLAPINKRGHEHPQGEKEQDPALENSLSVPLPISGFLFKRALLTMQQVHLRDGRTFGKLLGDSVTNAVQTVMIIGGYIMIFSVLLHVLNLTGVLSIFEYISALPAVKEWLDSDSIHSVITGLLEVHLGAFGFSGTASHLTVSQAAALAGLLGFGGFASHAQVKSLIYETDLRYLPFLVSRTVHALLSIVLTLVCWEPAGQLWNADQPSFLQENSPFAGASSAWLVQSIPLFETIMYEGILLTVLLALAIMISALLMKRKYSVS